MRENYFSLCVLVGCAALATLSPSNAYSGVIIGDSGFETPNQGSLSWTAKYQYNPTGAAWTFNGQTGVASNGCGLALYAATNGNSDGTQSDLGQAGFIQNGNGSISGTGSSSIGQTIFLGKGFYTLQFDAEGQNYANPDPISVYIYDGSMANAYLDMTFTPPSEVGWSASQAAFTSYSDSFSIAKSGNYGLYFVGDGAGNAGGLTFIDNVSITDPPAVLSATAPLPSAAWAGVSLMAGIYLIAIRRRHLNK